MSHSALLVVDVQRDVMDASILRDQVVANVGSLVDRARAQHVPVVWVRHHADDLPHGSEGWRIVGELQPAPGEPIVEKTYGDSFADTDLEQRLRELDVDRFVLCGAQSDACIRSTFYGGIYRGYPVTVVSDAHTTEDMREWGVPYSPQDAIAMINAQVEYTRLPDVQGAVVTTVEAFGGDDVARDER